MLKGSANMNRNKSETQWPSSDLKQIAVIFETFPSALQCLDYCGSIELLI